MPGFPMTEQWNLLELAPVQEIGVSLSSSGVLVPRKSTSMVIGIGPKMTRWTQAEVCARCSLNKTCPYRIKS
jgi:cobalamin-dependent methionine synthase I